MRGVITRGERRRIAVAQASRLVVGLGLLSLCAAAGAQDAGPSLVPGRMGFNALPAIPTVDPAIPGREEVEIAGTTEFDGSYRDKAAAPYVRLLVPFRGIAAVEMDGTPCEFWTTSESTQLRNGADRRDGVSPGDLRFGGRFLLREEDLRGPAIGLRIVVKSTTGKDQSAKRFTNAPAYAIQGLVGRDLVDGGVHVRAYAKLGFLAWQMGSNRQDDAVDYGLGLRAWRDGGLAVELDWRGYYGWRGDERPSVAEAAAELPIVRSVAVRAAFARGLTSDAPPYAAKLGFVFRFSLLPGRHAPARSALEPDRAEANPGANGASQEKGAEDDRRDKVANVSAPGLRWASTIRGREQDDVVVAVGVPR